MDVARMPEPGATEGSSRQDLLLIYEQTKTIAIGADVLWFQPGTHTTEAIQLAADAELTVVAGRSRGSPPPDPLLGDASTPADQYVSYKKKTNDRSLDHD
ncbi:MAG: hypothetical protein K0Q96_1811 [Rubrobacteraceae bacterium]|nr:hypothetical protein [Rubrobacteraceae bacterium]